MTEAGPVDLIDDDADDVDDLLPPPPEGAAAPHACPIPHLPFLKVTPAVTNPGSLERLHERPCLLQSDTVMFLGRVFARQKCAMSCMQKRLHVAVVL